MKIRNVAAAAVGGLFFCGATVSHATTVQPGSPLVLSFSSLPFVQISPLQPGASASINLTGDLLDIGDTIRLELFENSLADVPFYTHDFIVPSSNSENQFGAGIALPPPWQDVQGVIRLTALSGSIDVDNIRVGLRQDIAPSGTGCCLTNEYGQTFDFSTPLPAALPLFATGLGVLGLIGWRRKKIQEMIA